MPLTDPGKKCTVGRPSERKRNVRATFGKHLRQRDVNLEYITPSNVAYVDRRDGLVHRGLRHSTGLFLGFPEIENCGNVGVNESSDGGSSRNKNTLCGMRYVCMFWCKNRPVASLFFAVYHPVLRIEMCAFH
jgi:hypothetical protein